MSADLAQQDRDAGGECVRAGRSKATVALESEGKVGRSGFLGKGVCCVLL